MLIVFQSNRLETLLELLSALVQRPQANVFATETVVVQSKGMGRWVSLKLAESHGICANLQFPLPASYQWELLRAVFGELPRRSKYSPDAMAFRLLDWFSSPGNLARVPRLSSYLDDGDDIRRYQLARRIADLFDQYLVYRPDWIGAWQKGGTLGLGPDEAWQARLWREMSASMGETHRARLTERLLEALAGGDFKDRLPERLILFGISSLPPEFLRLIEKLSGQIDIALFAINPCRMHWGDIRDSQEIARQSGDESPEEMLLMEGNPLLASFGKQGREFFDGLQELAPDMHELFDEGPGEGSLLRLLQKDILDLSHRGGDSAFAGEEDPTGDSLVRREPRATVHDNDRSLQIHVCHGPMREVEVLRDQLLAMLDEDPDLSPSDIAVLTPDIKLYAPYIEAVFGSVQGPTRLPFAIADRSESDEGALLVAFLRLLDLPVSRFEAEWVMDFLEQDCVRERFGIGDQDLPAIHRRLRESGIRWGKDAAHRAALGLPAESRHAWREGLLRLLLGYALPAAVAGNGLPLFADVLPYDDVEGSVAETLGRFVEFAESLMQWSDRLKFSLRLEQWADLLGEMLESLFAPVSEEQQEDRQRLRDAFELLREIAELAEFSGKVEIPVVKRWLAEQLGGESGGGFLTGGVTFCAMVPMRSLPFKVICLLGLNDEAFPRRQRAAGFDLIARHPRRGDRSRRLDDRYLFLETLLSARQTLYISYVGRDIRDNAELPPSVLVADLLDAVDAGFEREGGGGCLSQVVTVHSLQAFHPDYFKGNPRKPSYSPHWLEAARQLGSGGENPAPFFGEDLPEPEEEWLSIDLAELTHFFSNPARYLLRRRLGIFFDAGDEAFENREPFALDYFDKDFLRDLALKELHGDIPPQSAQRLADANGLLPHGGFGRALFERERSTAKKLAPNILPLLDLPRLDPLSLRFEAHGVRLDDQLTGATPQGLIQWRLQAFSPRDLFALWIRHLALCLLRPDGVERSSVWVGENKIGGLGPVPEPEQALAELLGCYRRGLRRPLPFFVKSAWAYAEALEGGEPEAGLKAAHKTWDAPDFRNGNFRGESEDPYYRRVYGDGDPLDEDFERLALDLLGPLREAMKTYLAGERPPPLREVH